MKISCISGSGIFEVEKCQRTDELVTIKTKSSGIMRKICPEANVYMRFNQYCTDVALADIGAIITNALK